MDLGFAHAGQQWLNDDVNWYIWGDNSENIRDSSAVARVSALKLT